MPPRLSEIYPNVASSSTGNALIAQKLASGLPFIAGRLGTNEICLMALNGSFRARGVMPRCSGGGFHGTSGIYPETPAMLDEFLATYSEAVRMLGPDDLLACFRDRARKELPLFARYASRTPIVEAAALAPFFFDRPWSRHLANRTVAIVHPFAETIACQLRRRGVLFADPDVLPASTTFKMVPMFQALGRLEPHESWAETLQASAEPHNLAFLGEGEGAGPLRRIASPQNSKSVLSRLGAPPPAGEKVCSLPMPSHRRASGVSLRLAPSMWP